MNYTELWHRLLPVYDESEAKAVVRWVLDVRFGLSITDIYCGKVEQLSPQEQTELEGMMRRLEQSEPVQYVVGTADFCGRTFHVAPGVLIPRPETEELCRWITADGLTKCQTFCEVLDIGTGSGCIAVSLAIDIEGSKVTGWDISEKALRIAEDNAKRLQASVAFVRQDALHLPADKEQWSIIVSNPPYIDKVRECDGMAKNVLDYEPHIALFGPEEEPARFYRHIGDYAIGSLVHGGALYFELNPLTADAVVDYLRNIGFQEIEVRQDQFGKNRFLKAMKI